MGQKTLSPANAQPVADRPDLASAPAGEVGRLPVQPVAAALPDELPDFAKKADDLEAIKKAVDDAAAVGGALWLSYLFVLFYLAVAAGAVTHADLFFERPVKLPFLGIDLPLMAFFFLAPLLFLVVHAYTLVHLVLLTDKAKRYDQALEKRISDEKTLPRDVRERNAAVRAALRRQLPSNIFVQFLAGPKDLRDRPFGYLLRAIGWVTLVVAPVLLLLLMQIQFLPFHSSFIAWTQRGALLADLILIWWLWRKILSGRMRGPYLGPRWLWAAVGLALALGAFLFSWAIATFPGEWQEEALATWRFAPVSHASGAADQKPAEPHSMSLADWTAIVRDRAAPFWNWALTTTASLHDGIFNSGVDPYTHRRRLPFSSTLVLPGLNVYEELGVDDPEKIKGRDFVFLARGRDLTGAIFTDASLPKVDFMGARLEGASFAFTQLQGASLQGAQLQGAYLWGAQLQGALLLGASLQGAELSFASLQGASLLNASLQGASLQGAHLEATDLSDAAFWRVDRTPPPSLSALRRRELAAAVAG